MWIYKVLDSHIALEKAAQKGQGGVKHVARSTV